MRDVVEVPGVSGDDIFVILEYELDAPQDLLLSETSDCNVTVQYRNPSQIYYKEIYLRMDQISDPMYPMCDIREKHSIVTAESRREHRYHHGLALMAVLTSVDLSNEMLSVPNPFYENVSRKGVKLDRSLFCGW